jgi:tetratricopeptide (TPR) repeat protein
MKISYIRNILISLSLLLCVAINAQQVDDEATRRFDYFFMEACRLKMHGDVQKSAEMLQNCLKLDPQSAVAHFELGKLHLVTGDQKSAIPILRRAVVLNPKNEWYQVYLAGVFEHSKQLDDAIVVYENLNKSKPESLEYLYHLGDLYTKSKRYEEAINIYDKIEILDGVDEQITLEKQQLYLLGGETKTALKELKSLQEKYPNQARYHILLGDFYAAINDYKNAEKSFSKAESLDSDNGFLFMSLSSYYDQRGDSIKSHEKLLQAFDNSDIAYQSKIQILVSYMMAAAKEKTLEKNVEELTSSLKSVYPEEANTYFFYANYLIDDTSKREIVVENLEKVIKIEQTNEEAWTQLIRLAFQEEDFEKVIGYTTDALLADVKTTSKYFYRGIAAQQLKEVELAEVAFRKGVEIASDKDPIKPQLLGSLGDVYYALNAPAKAFEYYKKSLALDGHNTMVLNNYSYYLSENDTLLAEAETMSAKCIELDPGNATFLDTYAWILYMRENYLLAKFYMEKAINNIEHESDVIYDHYADILIKTGDREKAIKFWQLAIKTGGDADMILKKIEKAHK